VWGQILEVLDPDVCTAFERGCEEAFRIFADSNARLTRRAASQLLRYLDKDPPPDLEQQPQPQPQQQGHDESLQEAPLMGSSPADMAIGGGGGIEYSQFVAMLLGCTERLDWKRGTP
jgi:hypothetical protein